ncbi:MAG: response regulator transcription factor [Deinococcus sp.]|nr:response regulator transcription factor [Deinococcus sp.]
MSGKVKILVVEDQEDTAHLLQLELSEEGYQVLVAHDGINGLSMAREHSPDLVVLDVGLPGIGGLDVLRRLRKTSNVPIILLTGYDSAEDQVTGLDLGANDYVTKPFSPDVLMSRIRAQLRGKGASDDGHLRLGPLVVDPASGDVWRDGVLIAGTDAPEDALTKTEAEILALLVRHPGKIFDPDQIIDAVWDDYSLAPDPDTIKTHISNLRRKLGDRDQTLIRTARGRGYFLKEPR